MKEKCKNCKNANDKGEPKTEFPCHCCSAHIKSCDYPDFYEKSK